MTKKIFNAWELQQKVNEVDNKAEQTYVNEKVDTINSSLNNCVTKETGKGLSTNDFTNAYKTILDGLTTTINNAVLEGKKSLHPVNSIYLSMDSTNPNTLFGFGTWQLIGQGRTLVGVDTNDNDFKTVNKTGGSKTHTHSSGSIVANIGAIADDLGKIGYIGTEPQNTTYGMGVSGLAVSDMNTKKVNHATTTSGNTANASSLQPYITVYIWKRTA